jgi:hypothetical protein
MARCRISLRLLLLSVALFAVLFAWIGIEKKREQFRLKAELDEQQHIRRYLGIAPVFPGMEASHKGRIEKLDSEIAEKRERLGLQPVE